ncbi:hypothetical protein Tsubulata_050033 [Turnera subulata]|uniref:Fe2OG dioxygenase domain-containing protein n=1 Tax=Turnera subulata TaxID=218843 RepID=A0A9Q0EZ69_9ROSI|nr:hypothetical protein Tsubulata_050033 [Turnera subulata]
MGSGTTEWNSVKSQVQEALEEFGCFKALFNKIPQDQLQATYKAVEELFDLPVQTKMLNYSSYPTHGYLGRLPAAPLYESLGFENAIIPEEAEKLTNILWPQGNPKFSKTIQAFSVSVSELEQLVKTMIVQSLGLEKYKDEIMNSTNYLLKVMKYDVPKTGEKNIGMVSHEDRNLMTILHQNNDGLEIQTKTSEWIRVKTSPDSFIVLTGESLEAWTNGRVQPAPHRVMMTGSSEPRYSIALFSFFKAGYKVQAPEELVDKEHPLLYKPFDFGEFLSFSGSQMRSATDEWESVKSQVHKALEEYGCFEAKFDKVPIEIRKALFGSLEELFDLPLQTKLRNVSRKPYHGYVGQYPQVPLYESMGIDDANIYEKKLTELDQVVRKMILESLGLEEYLDEHMDSTNYLLRVMKYKGPQSTDTKLGLTSHTDKNIVTILYQNDVVGLEAWVNGRLHSPWHRVMMTGNEARYSTGLFSIPKAGYIIKAPEEVIDEEHPLLFKPFDHVKFLGFYYTEAGQKSPSALKEYCGV